MKIDEIRSETEQFFEWPEEPNGTVTLDSAILFARHCVEKIERQIADVIKARDAAMEMVGRLQEENAVLTAERDLFKKETVALVKDIQAPAGAAGYDGTWPAGCVQRAFVAGAVWAQFKYTGFTPFPAELEEAEQEAVRRYGEPS